MSLPSLQSTITGLKGLVAVGSCDWVKDLNIKINMLLPTVPKPLSSHIRAGIVVHDGRAWVKCLSR